jgi:glutaminase
MERREFAPREIVVRQGEPAHELFLVVRGDLSVLVDAADGRLHRLSTLTSGMGFGEPSMIRASGTRTAFVRADEPAVCWVLGRTAFESLDTLCPDLKIRLLENLLRSATRILGRLSFEVLAERM